MTTHATFQGRLVMLGFGSIGQGVLPLILRHIDMPRERISILSADDRGAEVAAAHGIAHAVQPITRENYRAVLSARLGRGNFLLNLSVDVSSVALVELCRELGALYLDVTGTLRFAAAGSLRAADEDA
jgi:homospermidine synthase